MAEVDPNTAFQQANALQRAGKIPQAVAIYQQLLRRFPRQPEVLQMLGTAELQLQQPEAAIQHLNAALEIQPDMVTAEINLASGLQALSRYVDAIRHLDNVLKRRPDLGAAYYNRANAYAALERIEEASADYARAAERIPGHAGAYYNLGNMLKKLGRNEEAVASYSRAIAIAPNISGGYNNRASAYRMLGRYEEALADYRKAVACNPERAEAHCNCANILRTLGRAQDSLAEYAIAIAKKPDFAHAYACRGIAFRELERPKDALADFDRALALTPKEGPIWNNRGNALLTLKRYDEALASFDKALECSGPLAEMLNNRANALRKLGRLEDALAAYNEVIARSPDYVEGYGNRGTVLYDLMRFDEALADYDHALALRPDYVHALLNKAHLLLLTGRFDEGLPLYESRWERAEFKKITHNYSKPLWRGDTPLAGKRLLIHPEQGLGDFLQFSRFAALASMRGAHVVLQTPSALTDLMRSMHGNIEVVIFGATLPKFDLHCPLMSLIYAFRDTLDKPAPTSYLAADAKRREHWLKTLGPRRRPRIGLCWAGSTSHNNDDNRSLALRALQPLVAGPYDFHALQKELRPGDAKTAEDMPNLTLHNEEIGDFSDTAALVSTMDLVITVDTSVAHLAGALGRPVWILLPQVPDWRWRLDRSDSPWYPTARLFRQPAFRDWNAVIDEVTRALPEFIPPTDGIPT